MSFQQYPFKGGIPSGTTAQRPGSPAIGDVYYNGDLGLLEIYTSAGWQPSSAPSGTPAIVVTDLGPSRAYTDGPAFKVDFTPSTLGGFATGYTVSATSSVTASVYSGTSTTTSITVATSSGANGYGALYTVSAASYNGFGASPYVTGAVVTTTKPQAPTIGTASLSTTTSAVTVTWTNNANGGIGLSSIRVRAYSGATLVSTTTAATTSSTSATITGLSTNTVYTFKVFATNSNGDSPESAASNSIGFFQSDVLIVAGGGGGSSIIGGGGGAGGVRKFTGLWTPLSSSVTVTVGAGGRGGTGYSSNVSEESGYPGWDSVFGSLSASGGGGAIGWTGHGSTPSFSGQRTWSRNGGSGAGGSANNSTTTGVRGTGNLGGYSPVEGYNGGDGDSDAKGLGGGGGGASAAGIQVAQSGNTNGGAGLADSITGSSVTYGGGGAAGRRRSFNGGGSASGQSIGGAGGGGTTEADGTFRTAQNGGANLGGGGSGGNYEGPGSTSQAGGNGGSGTVILRIPSSLSATFSGGVTSSLNTSVSGFKIYSVTAAGTSDTVTFSVA